MSTVKVPTIPEGVKLNDEGSGPPVLLLHSSGLSSLQWRRLREKLADRYRVLTPDLIGYGGSAPWSGEGDFHFRSDLALVEAVAASADAPVHLAGHSYGGFLALQLALTGRIPVASIAVFEPVAFGVLASANDREGLDDLARLHAAGDFFAPELEGTAAWAERFVDYWGGPGYWSRLPSWQQAAFLAPGRKLFQEVRSISEDRTPHTAYARIKAPMLVMHGGRTAPGGRRTAEILAQSIPGARLEVVEDAGHMAPLTHADQVNALIAQHIDRNQKHV